MSIPNPTNLLSTRELVVELNDRLKTGYGVVMVTTDQLLDLYTTLFQVYSKRLDDESSVIWPTCG